MPPHDSLEQPQPKAAHPRSRTRPISIEPLHSQQSMSTYQPAMKQRLMSASLHHFRRFWSTVARGTSIPFGAIKPVHSSSTSYTCAGDPLRRLRLRDPAWPLVLLRRLVKDLFRRLWVVLLAPSSLSTSSSSSSSIITDMPFFLRVSSF